MKTKFIIFLCFLFALGYGSLTSALAACPDGSDNCNITGEYQIDSKRALKMSESNGMRRDIYIGENSGALNPDANNRAYGNVFLGRNTGKNMEIGAVNTFIGDKVAENLKYGIHNTYIGAGVGQVATFNPEDPTEYSPSYNTIVGSIAGQNNIGGGNVFIGTEAGRYNTTGNYNVGIGIAALSNYYDDYNICLDSSGCVNKTGENNIHVGIYTGVTSPDLHDTIALGFLALSTNSHQMVVGSHFKNHNNNVTDNGVIRESYWGSGVLSEDPQDFSFNTSGGIGSNIGGANLIIAGGKSTGSANGGSIKFQTAAAGANSGSSQNTLRDRVIIDSSGNVTFGDGSDRYAPSLNFDTQYLDCGMQYDGENEWIKSTCAFNMQGGSIYLRNMNAQINSPSGGNVNIKATEQITLQTPKLNINSLPNTPPDGSGTRGIVCITNNGNMWVDDDGDVNICQ